MFRVKGYAGTGKTFLITRFIEYVLTMPSKHYQVAVTAPTNKAVKVLRDESEYTHTRLKFATIHSLLGLKEQIDAYGVVAFERDKREPSSLDSYEVLIVDEASMLADELFAEIHGFVASGKLL